MLRAKSNVHFVILLFSLALTACATEKATCNTLNFVGVYEESDDKALIVKDLTDLLSYHADNFLGIKNGSGCNVSISLSRLDSNSNSYTFEANLENGNDTTKLEIEGGTNLDSTLIDYYAHQILRSAYGHANISSKRPFYDNWSYEDVENFQCDWSTKLTSPKIPKFQEYLHGIQGDKFLFEEFNNMAVTPNCRGGICKILAKNGHQVYLFNDRELYEAYGKFGHDDPMIVSEKGTMPKHGYYLNRSNYITRDFQTDYIDEKLDMRNRIRESFISIGASNGSSKVLIFTRKLSIYDNEKEVMSLNTVSISNSGPFSKGNTRSVCPGRLASNHHAVYSDRLIQK